MERLIDARYTILGELGSGGMGTVYQVRDERSGQTLALKILTAEGERQRERLLRFRREFRAASMLVHPNIVRVHDFVAGRLCYFTMEYFQGRPISAAFGLGERRLSSAELNQPERVRRLYSVLHQVCLALGYIHSQSIVHRDLKPENILIADAPAEGQTAPLVKVMDFGLARDLRETVALTQPGTVLGTLSYLSPEQATGRVIDGRSDLYGLGVLMYLLLTGTTPFGTDSVSNILWKHCSQAPEPPRLRNPGVNRALESICLRLLLKDPFDRFQTAFEVLRMIEKAGRGSYPLPDVVRTHEAGVQPGLGQVFAPRMVGRDGELGRLLETVEAASEGLGSVVCLSGPPGVGRTRILFEASERARSAGALVLSARFDPRDPRPLVGMRPMFEELVRVLSGLPDAEVLTLAGPDGAALPFLDPTFSGVRPLARAAAADVRASASGGHQRAREALPGLLRRLGRRSPVVLAFDDMDAADELSAAFVTRVEQEALAQSVGDPFAGEPGLVLWTTWQDPPPTLTGGVDPDPVVPVPDARGLRLAIPPLGLAHGSLLMHSMFGQDPDDFGLAEMLWAAAEGRPGEIEELVRLAVAEGVLRARGGRWSVDGERVSTLRPRATPGAGRSWLSAAIDSRLESTGPAGEAMLGALALLPCDSSFEVLAAGAGLDDGPAIDVVEALLRARLIEEGQGAARVQIALELVRQVVLARLPVAARATIHGRALEALERAARAPDPLLLAHFAWEARRSGDARRLLPDAVAALELFGAQRMAALWQARLQSLRA